MWETIKSEWEAKVALLIFFFFAIWWLFIQFPVGQSGRAIELFGSTYFILAAWGSLWGGIIAAKWGGIKSVLGKALVFYTLGLFAQVFGQIAYSYYIYVLHVDVPYPSMGDLGYFGSIPFYIIATIYLARVSGVKIGLKSYKNKIQAMIIPVVVLLVGYFLFLQGYQFDWGDPLKVFLDFGYPLGQAVYMSLAILTYLLTRDSLGGVMKSRVLFILFALIAQFISDYSFLYEVSRGIWKLGGINEFMYLFSYLCMTLALMQLKTVYNTLKH